MRSKALVPLTFGFVFVLGCSRDKATTSTSTASSSPVPVSAPASASAPSPAPVTVRAVQSGPIPAIEDKDAWSMVLKGIASANGVKVEDVEVKAALASGRSTAAFVPFVSKIKGPTLESGSLYFADINNDGQTDWVLCSTNPTGLHDSSVAGVYTPSAGAFVAQELPKTNPFAGATYFGTPFLEAGPDGVVMTVWEKPKPNPSGQPGGRPQLTEKVRYQWKGKDVRALSRERQR